MSPTLPDSVFLDYVERLRRHERQNALQHPVIWHGSVPTDEDLKRAAQDRRVWALPPDSEQTVLPPYPARELEALPRRTWIDSYRDVENIEVLVAGHLSDDWEVSCDRCGGPVESTLTTRSILALYEHGGRDVVFSEPTIRPCGHKSSWTARLTVLGRWRTAKAEAAAVWAAL